VLFAIEKKEVYKIYRDIRNIENGKFFKKGRLYTNYLPFSTLLTLLTY